jgi:hypothetical protein
MNDATHSFSTRIGRIALCLVGAAAGAAVLLGSTCNLTNKAPSVPVISGPSTGVVGVPVTFKATATDPEGDSIAFQFDWGDTTTPAWSAFIASGETTSVQHVYTDSGSCLIRAKAKDKKGSQSSWSGEVTLDLLSASPEYPDSIYGSCYIQGGVGRGVISPDGTVLCMGTRSGCDSVSILRVSDRTLLPRIRVDTLIAALAFLDDNRYVFASSWNSGRIYRVDLTEGRVVDSVSGMGLPYDLAVTPDRSRLLACVNQNIYVLRTDTLAILDSVHLPYNAYGMALDKTGATLYVSTLHGIGVVDVAECSLRLFTQAVDNSGFPTLSVDEESLYVLSGTDSGVTVVRTSDLSVTRRVGLHIHGASHMKRTPDGNHIYIGYGGTHILDTRTLLPVDSIDLPFGGYLAMHPSGDSVYYFGGTVVYVIGKKH